MPDILFLKIFIVGSLIMNAEPFFPNYPPICFSIQRVEETGSTNDDLKQLAAAGAPEGTVVLAQRQSGGKGQRGRAFVSQAGGLYMSLLLRPEAPISSALYLTPMAANAVCAAIEALTELQPAIKWVNDVYCRQHKVCGILCEAAPELSTGKVCYVVMGIGLNIFPPEQGFQGGLEQVAGTLFEDGMDQRVIDRFAECILAEISKQLRLSRAQVLEQYRSRSLLTGQQVTLQHDQRELTGKVEGITEEFELILRTEDGQRHCFCSGDVILTKYSK